MKKNDLKCDSLQQSLQNKIAARIKTIEYNVGEHVVLAGQPQPEDMPALSRQGIRTVINLRREPGRSAVEQRNAEAAGLAYIHLPLPAYELEPQHLAQFQAAITGREGLYIHCRSASRVALLWMLHRVVNEGWRREDAEAELRSAGYGEESMETFAFCAEDYFERMAESATAG